MYARCKIRAFNFMDPPVWKRTCASIMFHAICYSSSQGLWSRLVYDKQ